MTNKAVDIFKSADENNALLKYKKVGIVQVQPAVPGENLETIINGEKETQKIAGENDFIVQNATGEIYLLHADKLNERYTYVGKSDYAPNVELYEAKGTVWGIQYTGEESFQFQAPWNELMLCNPGDFIVSTVRGQYTDVYRIEKGVMAVTYKQVPD